MWINFNDHDLALLKDQLTKRQIMYYEKQSEFIGIKMLLDKIGEWKSYQQPELDPIIIEKARELYADDETEIDDDPAVSHADGGNWVAAWVWVSNDDLGACEECGAIPGTSEYGTVGDGYDGLCPSCADKSEEDEE